MDRPSGDTGSVTRAMAAGVTNHFWKLEEIIALLG
jgi:hypothetical protein